MIASFLHNFIFIKTQKTGGTTVETVLANFCGPDDIITPLGKKDERARSNGTPVCRNFAGNSLLEREWIDGLFNSEDGPQGRRNKLKFYAHIPAVLLKPRLDPAFWDRAFKFTIERHPYERVVSKALFKLGRKRPMERFPEFLNRILEEKKYTSFNFYAIDGEVVVDEIIKLENLEADLQRVGQRIGISIPNPLPRMKSVSRRDKRPAREILSDEQKAEICRVCKVEFDLLGYEP